MPTEHIAQMATHAAAAVERRALTPNAPSVMAGDWYAPEFSIQTWLERTPWRTLKGTHFGMGGEAPHPVFWDDPLIQEIHKIDVATFLTAEHISVEGISRLVSMAPDEASRLFLATQTIDEARHYEVFCRRMADVGVSPAERLAMVGRVTTRELRTFYDLIREQVDRGDLVSAMVAHNIVLEGMAYPIYRYEIKYWSKLDPGLSRMIQGAFADEVHHVGFGEAFVADAVRHSPAVRARVTKLCREASGLMNNVFNSVVRKYIGLYQTVADRHRDLMGDIQIFPGKLMADISEEDQVRTLSADIQRELSKRLAAIHINLD